MNGLIQYWPLIVTGSGIVLGVTSWGIKRHVNSDDKTRERVGDLEENTIKRPDFERRMQHISEEDVRAHKRIETSLNAHAKEVRDGLTIVNGRLDKVLLGLAKLNGIPRHGGTDDK